LSKVAVKKLKKYSMFSWAIQIKIFHVLCSLRKSGGVTASGGATDFGIAESLCSVQRFSNLYIRYALKVLTKLVQIQIWRNWVTFIFDQAALTQGSSC
jgi:hypothetical protein